MLLGELRHVTDPTVVAWTVRQVTRTEYRPFGETETLKLEIEKAQKHSEAISASSKRSKRGETRALPTAHAHLHSAGT